MRFIILPVIIFTFHASAEIQKNFLNIAHRGAAAYAHENTLSSFKKAIELGANYLEIDVRQSKDAELVVLHDSKVNRTTNGSGSVSKLTLLELKKLDAGSGEKIPTLREIFELVRDHEIKLIIELKGGSSDYQGIEKNTVNLIKEFGYSSRVILKSFEVKTLDELFILVPEIPQLFVFFWAWPQWNFVFAIGPSFFNVMEKRFEYLQVHRFFITDSFIKLAHEKNKKVIVWGVDEKDFMRELMARGVDGIETDHPDWLQEILQRNKN